MSKKNNIKNASEKKPSEIPISVRKMAAIIRQHGVEVGRNDLFEWLRKDGLCKKYGNSNLPTDYAKSFGLMKVELIIKNDMDFPTTMITPKGQNYILDRFLNKAA